MVLIKQDQLPITQSNLPSEKDILSLILQLLKLIDNSLSKQIMLIMINVGLKTQDQVYMTLKRLVKNNLILQVKIRYFKAKYLIAKILKKEQSLQDQEHIKQFNQLKKLKQKIFEIIQMECLLVKNLKVSSQKQKEVTIGKMKVRHHTQDKRLQKTQGQDSMTMKRRKMI